MAESMKKKSPKIDSLIQWSVTMIEYHDSKTQVNNSWIAEHDVTICTNKETANRMCQWVKIEWLFDVMDSLEDVDHRYWRKNDNGSWRLRDVADIDVAILPYIKGKFVDVLFECRVQCSVAKRKINAPENNQDWLYPDAEDELQQSMRAMSMSTDGNI